MQRETCVCLGASRGHSDNDAGVCLRNLPALDGGVGVDRGFHLQQQAGRGVCGCVVLLCRWLPRSWPLGAGLRGLVPLGGIDVKHLWGTGYELAQQGAVLPKDQARSLHSQSRRRQDGGRSLQHGSVLQAGIQRAAVSPDADRGGTGKALHCIFKGGTCAGEEGCVAGSCHFDDAPSHRSLLSRISISLISDDLYQTETIFPESVDRRHRNACSGVDRRQNRRCSAACNPGHSKVQEHIDIFATATSGKLAECQGSSLSMGGCFGLNGDKSCNSAVCKKGHADERSGAGRKPPSQSFDEVRCLCARRGSHTSRGSQAPRNGYCLRLPLR